LTITFNNVSSKYYATTVKDQNNRTYTFTYENSPSDNSGKYTLRSITDPMGNVTRFSYGGNNWITGVTYPKGNTPYTQTYKSGETRGIVGTQTDAYSNQTTITKTNYDPYSQRESQFSITYPDGSSRSFVHDHYSRVMKKITDQTGKSADITADESGTTPGKDQIQTIKDRLGDTTTINYHAESGKIASITNAKGQTTTNTYTAQNQTFTNTVNNEQVTFTFYNLTQITYSDGTNERLNYDIKGNLTSYTDRANKTTTYTYNSSGQVLTATNPNGGVITNTYNADGTLATTKDSETGTTTFEYDVYGRPIAIREEDGSTIQIGYNLNDQILTETDAIGRTTTYTYDANSKLTKITDRKSKEEQFVNDNMDRIVSNTDRLGKTTTYEYDNMERVKKITDPNGIVKEFGYNTRGWHTSTTIGGRQWSYEYDAEGVLSKSTTPLGNSTTYLTDKLGYVSTIRDPLNNTVTFTRDSLNRITGITDPLNRQTTFGYDNRGLLTGITTPVIGSTAYTYNDSGYLTRLTDLKGSQWNFTRTNMGRMSRMTDPLNRHTNFYYDTKGRLQTITHPDGTTSTYTYDNNDNLITATYTGMTAINNTFDEEDRLIGSNDLSFNRDDEGRVTSTIQSGVNYDATYNNGGQLQSVTYNNALFTVNYTYNTTTGLLQTISDTLTGTIITFNYDNDNRLIGVARPNNVNGTYTYDNAGRRTRIQEGSIVDIQHTYNGAGEITSSSFTAPLDPANYITSATTTNSYDNASQISTSGYAHDQLGRLTAGGGNTYTWDTASRLTGINNATMTYNGLGNILTRTEGGQIARYYYNHAIDLSPIMVIKNEATNTYKYFVWTPAGRLLYMIDGADGNKVYHYYFDDTGSTLELTNAAGTVTDSYAYDPYGKVIGKNGNTSQPFTFVGAWGVRQEGDGGIYHMRARYYDSNTTRFISKEPIWPQIASPKSLNPYQYAANNPMSFINITGNDHIHNLALAAREESRMQRSMYISDIRFRERDSIFVQLETLINAQRFLSAEQIKFILLTGKEPPEIFDLTPSQFISNKETTHKTVSKVVAPPEVSNSALKEDGNSGYNIEKKIQEFASKTGRAAKKAAKELVKKGKYMPPILKIPTSIPVNAVRALNPLKMGSMAATSRITAAVFKDLKMLKNLSNACTLVGGATSIYQLGDWALSTPEERYSKMSEELSFQAVDFAARNKILNKYVISPIGGVVSWILGD
ncbi:MAG: hypothetical protein N2738_05825, partial [Thermodesulfovibrionales bacterium]|nr:hypothetical protein [Thermodesulfovibrionales bacterium]